MMNKNEKMSLICYNKNASFNYNLENKIECGIILTGDEVKSIRVNKTDISQSHIIAKNNELFIINWHIPEYKNSYRIYNEVDKYNANRMRKLLLHKKEIARVIGSLQVKGKACIPLECYTKGNKIKLIISLATGKKEYDKREYIKQKDQRRENKRSNEAI